MLKILFLQVNFIEIISSIIKNILQNAILLSIMNNLILCIIINFEYVIILVAEKGYLFLNFLFLPILNSHTLQQTLDLEFLLSLELLETNVLLDTLFTQRHHSDWNSLAKFRGYVLTQHWQVVHSLLTLVLHFRYYRREFLSNVTLVLLSYLYEVLLFYLRVMLGLRYYLFSFRKHKKFLHWLDLTLVIKYSVFWFWRSDSLFIIFQIT